MPMCLQSMPSIQSLAVRVYLFVNTMIQGIFCSVAVLYQASYCFEKKKKTIKTKPLLSQIFTLVFLKLISVVMMQEEMEVRWEFTTAIPVYLPSMSITQYDCHPVAGLCNYFAK